MSIKFADALKAEQTVTKLEVRIGGLLERDLHDGLAKAETILQEIRVFLGTVEEADAMQAAGTQVDPSFAVTDMRLGAQERLLGFLLGRETINPKEA